MCLKTAEDPGRLGHRQENQLVRSITSRDLSLLNMLHQHRYLSRDQVTALYFTGVRSMQLRTQWLKERGLIQRWTVMTIPGWRQQQSVLLISTRGARLLAHMRGNDPRAAVRRAEHAAAHSAHLNHDVRANGFFVDLAVAARDLADQGLNQWVGEEACRQSYRERGSRISPDGWGRYLSPGGEVTVLLEWDCATESPARIAAKGTDYVRHFVGRQQADLNHVVFVTPSDVRETRVADAILRALPATVRPCCRFWTTTVDRLHLAGHLGSVWREVSDPSGRRVPITHLQATARTSADAAICIAKPAWWVHRPDGGQPA